MHPESVRLVYKKGMHNLPTEVAAHDSLLLVTPQAQTHGHVPSQGVYPANRVDQSLKPEPEPSYHVQVEVKITGRNVGNLQVFWGYLWHQRRQGWVGNTSAGE